MCPFSKAHNFHPLQKTSWLLLRRHDDGDIGKVENHKQVAHLFHHLGKGRWFEGGPGVQGHIYVEIWKYKNVYKYVKYTMIWYDWYVIRYIICQIYYDVICHTIYTDDMSYVFFYDVTWKLKTPNWFDNLISSTSTNIFLLIHATYIHQFFPWTMLQVEHVWANFLANCWFHHPIFGVEIMETMKEI